jgi:flagellar secretion chaperone FliS
MAAQSNDYLQSKVFTANPAQLHLMLIEGALRFSRSAEQALVRDDVRTAETALVRAIDIVAELLAGVRANESELNTKLAALYQYCFGRLTQAYVNGDQTKLDEAVKILAFERDTWRQACETIAAETPPAQKPHGAVPMPHVAQVGVMSGSLSLQG